MDNSFYLNMFHTSVEDMDRIIAAALSGGCNYADLYFENTLYRSLTLKDGTVASGGVHVDYGVGIRSLCGGKCGYAYCENTDFPDMLKAAKAASSIALYPDQREWKGFGPSKTSAMEDKAAGLWEMADNRRLMEILELLESKLRARDSRIIKVIGKISGSDSYIMMYNSLGELRCDSRPMGSLNASIIFSAGQEGPDGASRTENRSSGLSFRLGPEMFEESMVDQLVDTLCSGIDRCLEAGRPKGGRMPVVMGAGASGILLHEAMGHAFEADFNRKGQSIFCDKMGQQVCPKGINIVDDGTWTDNRGELRYDDEGIAGQKTYMVEDGILTSYLHDRLSASYYGVEPTGNGRREGFRYPPIPRMRLTYMESGNDCLEDMISSIDKGIYVDEFSNGQVKIGEGDFTFYVKSGYEIENGRLTRPIKDINVIGNGPQALSDIEMVGADLKIDNSTWTCGKDQSVPVGCGMPSVKVRELTVGGE